MPSKDNIELVTPLSEKKTCTSIATDATGIIIGDKKIVLKSADLEKFRNRRSDNISETATTKGTPTRINRLVLIAKKLKCGTCEHTSVVGQACKLVPTCLKSVSYANCEGDYVKQEETAKKGKRKPEPNSRISFNTASLSFKW